MKVLVTGGAGFIGSHITDRLIAEGHSTVIIDNLSTGKEENINPKAKFYKADIISPNVKEIIKIEKPDIICHFAAQVKVQKSMQDVLYDARCNIIGTVNILEGAREAGTKKVIYPSSAAVYGNPKYLPVDENHTIQPLSFYGISKHIPGYYLDLYKKEYGINYTIFRFSNVYGPRQVSSADGGVVAIFMDSILNNKPLVIYGSGEQTRDFIYVKDVVNATVCALNRGDNEVFNISCNTQNRINDLFYILEDLTGSRINVVHKEFRSGDIMYSCLDNKKAAMVLNWNPKYSLREGLMDMYKYYLHDFKVEEHDHANYGTEAAVLHI